MPNINLPIPEVTQTVSRPVILEIIQNLQKLTGVSKEAKIFFPGDIQSMQTAGSSIDHKDRHAIFDTNLYMFIEVEEDHDIQSLGTTAVSRQEHIPVFEDESLRVQVTPVYSTTNVTINFKYRSPSKNEVLKWRDDIRMKISNLRDINLHSVSYHYSLPEVFLEILKEIHTKRENVLGYDQGLLAYLQSYSTDRLTIVADLTGTTKELAIAETQTRIQGLYGFEGMPEKPEREDSGNWTISFSYKFNYEKPIGCHIRYPVMVHNQLLNEKYTEFSLNHTELNKVSKSFSKSLHAMQAFESDTIMNAARKPDPIIRIPSCDDFPIKQVAVGSGSVFYALTQVEADKRTLLNLNDLGDIHIDDDILEFIKESEYPYITQQFKSILHLSLYRNEFLTSDRSLTCDSNLNVKATKDLDFRTQHRVRLSIVTNLSLLQKGCIQRLRNYPKALTKIIGSMNELLSDHPDFVNMGQHKRVSALHFDRIYGIIVGGHQDTVHNEKGHYFGPGMDGRNLFKDLDPRIVQNYRNNRQGFNTVMISKIVARRLD